MDIIMIMLRTIYDIYLVANIVSVSVNPLITLLINSILGNYYIMWSLKLAVKLL